MNIDPTPFPEVRLALLEKMSTDMAEIVKDHEKRLRWIERVVLYGMGMVGLGYYILHVIHPA